MRVSDTARRGSTWRTQARIALRAEQARRDVNAFCEYVMRTPEGDAWVQQSFHRAWQALLPVAGPARVLIGAPRESAKTTQLSIARVIWELGRNPELRIKIVTSTDDLAADIVASIAEHISRNARVRQVFPHLKPASQGLWPKPGARTSRLVVARKGHSKDPSVSGHGVLSTGVGGRADLIVFDDVVDYRNAIASPALRGQVAQSCLEVWINLLGPKGRGLCVGTVWHEEDLTMQLKANPAWTVWWQPARDAVTGEPLWADRWSAEALAARELEIGPRSFARQYLLIPLSDQERTFPDEVLDACRDANYAPGQVQVPDRWPRYSGVDLAASLGQKASYTVMMTIALDPDSKRRYPLEIVRVRQHFPDTIQMIRDQWEKWHPALIHVESNAFQEVVVQQLVQYDRSIPVKAYQTGSEKMDAKVGIPSLSAGMANGSWLIPAGGTHPAGCACGWCAWVRELSLHPGGEHSDCVMAMWLADLAARQGLGLQASLLPPSQPSIPGWRSTASELRAMSSVPTGRNWGCANSWEERLARARRVETPENSRSR